jgi:flagellar biogenesis protein FliO
MMIIRAILTLLGIATFLLLSLYLIRKYQKNMPFLVPRAGAGRRIQLQSSLFLDNRHRVVLLSIDQTEVALLLSPQGATQLHYAERHNEAKTLPEQGIV